MEAPEGDEVKRIRVALVCSCDTPEVSAFYGAVDAAAASIPKHAGVELQATHYSWEEALSQLQSEDGFNPDVTAFVVGDEWLSQGVGELKDNLMPFLSAVNESMVYVKKTVDNDERFSVAFRYALGEDTPFSIYEESDELTELLSENLNQYLKRYFGGEKTDAETGGEAEEETGDKAADHIPIHGRAATAISDGAAEKDYLDRDYYAKAFARLITHKGTNAPLTIGLFAPWGEGKSSLMKLIENEVKKLNENHRLREFYDTTHVVNFNAWEYDDQKKVWAGLLKKLIDGYIKDKGWFFGRLKFSRKRINEQWQVPLLVSVLFAVGLWTLYWLKPWLLTDIPGLVVTASTFFGLGKSFGFLKAPFGRGFYRYFRFPNYDEQLGFRAEIGGDLENIMDCWIERDESAKGEEGKPKVYKERILLFIDDLDRCAQDKVVQVLEALQLFLQTPGLVTVIGVDHNTVGMAVAEKYKHQFDKDAPKSEKLRFGFNYLEKIVQVPFQIPRSGSESIGRYVDELLGSAGVRGKETRAKAPRQKDMEKPPAGAETDTSGKDKDRSRAKGRDPEPKAKVHDNDHDHDEAGAKVIVFDDKEVEVIKELMKGSDRNPRRTKRLINILRMSKYLMRTGAIKGLDAKTYSLDQLRLLVRWYIVCMRWPNFASRLSSVVLGLGEAENDKNIADHTDSFKNDEWVTREIGDAKKYLMKGEDVLTVGKTKELIPLSECFFLKAGV